VAEKTQTGVIDAEVARIDDGSLDEKILLRLITQ